MDTAKNIIAVELRGNELKDLPLQRDGFLYGKTINVDMRELGYFTDDLMKDVEWFAGEPGKWYGTPLADMSGYAGLIRRGIGELTTAAGTIKLQSSGDLVTKAGSLLTASGGSIHYTPAMIATTRACRRQWSACRSCRGGSVGDLYRDRGPVHADKRPLGRLADMDVADDERSSFRPGLHTGRRWRHDQPDRAPHATERRRPRRGGTVRFFGGWDFVDADAQASDVAKAGYNKGVPMGGDLNAASNGKSPTFLVAAIDPEGGNLNRIQVVKGWVDAKGARQEKRLQRGLGPRSRKPGADGKLPAVGNTVDVPNATYTNTIGAAQPLPRIWKDPAFDPGLRAVYYARVIEIPTPRWTAYDAKRFNVKMPKDVRMTTQERAYTSPIWYTPAR